MKQVKTHLTHEGAALMSVLIEAIGLFHRLRDMGRESGHVSASGGGIWGFLNSLAVGGAQTVPALARQRPVSRQHMQIVANEAAADGLVEFIDNPHHRRSKLVTLTEKGRTRHAELTQDLAARSVDLARGMDAHELENAARILGEVKRRLGRNGPG